LSFELKRPERVIAAGQNMYGDPVVIEGTGYLSRALQHETDHLDGVIFIDRLDKAAAKQAKAAIREAEWFGEPTPEVKVSPHPLFGRAL
jgi:peptide deformylase